MFRLVDSRPCNTVVQRLRHSNMHIERIVHSMHQLVVVGRQVPVLALLPADAVVAAVPLLEQHKKLAIPRSVPRSVHHHHSTVALSNFC